MVENLLARRLGNLLNITIVDKEIRDEIRYLRLLIPLLFLISLPVCFSMYSYSSLWRYGDVSLAHLCKPPSDAQLV